MKKAKYKIIKSITILLVCIISPIIILTTNLIYFNKANVHSALGVIIGPTVFPGLDGGIGDGTIPANTDYSNANLKQDTPYPDGALRAYSSLGIYNSRRDETDGLLKYLSFVRYFKVVRNDGRYIYDDDGILDTYDISSLGDEVVDYKAYITATCTTLPHDNGGFFWTERQGRFKDAKLLLKEWKKYSNMNIASIEKTLSKDLPTNPSNQVLNLGNLYQDNENTYSNSDLASISFDGTCYWENTFWGGTGDNFILQAGLNSGWFRIKSRDWNNTLTANVSSANYRGSTAYYSPKEFTAIASNLNNYVKLNDVRATSQYGTSVVPYKDGHHIYLTDSFTKVEIENGAENTYTTYYCFIDNTLPEVSYNYLNSNALDNRKVGTITTDTTGAKSQTIYEGLFKDQVQVIFSYDENTEAPESATYTYNGNTYNLTSGTWLSQDGDYIVTVRDLAGNTTISKFTIDSSSPSQNLAKLQSDKTYKISRWYLANIPYNYIGSGSYSFATYEDALNSAKIAELKTNATSYTLEDGEEFIYTNLIANGDSVKVGRYWYYKSKDSPNLYVYYFDNQLLDEAITHYAKNFVSEAQTYKINSTLNPNNYGNEIGSSVINNIINDGYIVNNFTFRYYDDSDTYKIFYDYQNDNTENWIEFQYNVPFISQVNSSGLYKIKEIDFVGHETIYYVYYDNIAPMLDIEVKLYGKDRLLEQTISVADIPNNNELIFYYEKFSIKQIIEDDIWWTMEVKCPDGKTLRYTYLDELPNFDELGSGQYTITIADRTNNQFSFKVGLVGKAPEVKFENINANTQLKITILTGESYNIITDLKIYRNDICLNTENGYDEFPEDDSNSLININPSTLRYIFNKGGIYIVEITDNFGRTLAYEYKFEKDLPIGILVGVIHNGKTKDEVKFVYDSNKYFVVVSKDEQNYEADNSVDGKITTLYFNPEEESENHYLIRLTDKLDTDNYNIYSFTIKTIKPILYLYGVEPDGKTGGNVYASWENDEEQYTSTYTNNGETKEYRKGQILTNSGYYTITLKDEIGNEAKANFEIDKSIDFLIEDFNGNKYSIEEIKYINFDIRIIEQEPLNITLTKNDTIIDYEFGLMITDESLYKVRLNDEFNNSIFFTFTIDKTPPKATLYGVENFGKTNKSAWITSSESELTCWFVRDENFRDVYCLGSEITTNGKYIVYIADKAKNYTTFEFEIDKKINYDINTYRGGISNGGVRLIAYENLKIIMYKDGKPFDYSFEQILNDDGEYSYTITDELGNKTSSFFNIITKKKQNLNHILQQDISVVEILKDDEICEYQILDSKLYLFDEGHYFVKIIDEQTSIQYSFEITLDTTPPTLELIGVENGGTTKKIVVMKNVSEKPYTLNITVDGANFEYKIGDEIERCGRFEVVLIDEAGNSTTSTFERIYSLNGPSIAVLAGLGALVVLLIIFLVKNRRNHYAEEITEEELEETTTTDDVDSGNEENPENQ